jgi:hypothetical protein
MSILKWLYVEYIDFSHFSLDLYWSSGVINAPDFVELCPVLVYILNYKRFQEPVYTLLWYVNS